MGIVKKTKEEREASRDTPLAESPESTKPITDLKSALADINARSQARQKAISATNEKLNANRVERNKSRRSIAGGGGGLYGLASFASTTGRQVK